MRALARVSVLLLAIVALLAIAGATYEAIASARDRRLYAPLGLHEGKVSRNERFYDLSTILRQLGAFPADKTASTHSDSAERPDDSASQKEIENQIIALEKRMWNGDANEISKLEAEDYEVIKHAHRYHRADDEAAAKDVKFALTSMDDIRVRMLRPDVALITYHATQKGSFRGTEVPPSLYFGSIWVNRSGDWKNVFLEENAPDVFTDIYKPSADRAQPQAQRSEIAQSRSLDESFFIESAAFAQTGEGGKPLTSDEKALLEIDHAWGEAEQKQDAAMLNRILDDRFLYLGSSGKVSSKSDVH